MFNAVVSARRLCPLRTLWFAVVSPNAQQLHTPSVEAIRPRLGPRGPNLFHCPSCRAKKLMTGSSKSRPHSPSPTASIASVSTHETMQNMQRSKTSLCDRDNFCASCVSLKAVADRLSTALSDSRRENKTLQLQILGLVDRVRTLEEAVKALGRLDSVEKELESLKATKVHAQQGQFHQSQHSQRSRPGPRPRGYGRPRQPRQRDASDMKSEASEGASFRPSQSGRQATNGHTGRTPLDAKCRRSTNPFNDSYRIVWGTRFTTSAPPLLVSSRSSSRRISVW